MENNNVNHALDMLYTKIASIVAGGTYTAGTVVSTVDVGLGILFKVLSVISLILIIAINWDNGIARIKKVFKSKKTK